LLYKPYPQAGFVIDAHYIVKSNPQIKNIANIGDIFRTDFFQAFQSTWKSTRRYYRPLTTLSLMSDYQIWRLTPYGFRLTNLLFHWVNGLLIFWLLQLLFKNFRLAALSAVLFCILPVHEWVVHYIVGRGDLLQVFFSLGCLILLVKAEQEKSVRYYSLSCICYGLALLSREVAILLPLHACLVLVYLHRLDVRMVFRRLVPFLLIALVYYILRKAYLPIIQESMLHVFSWTNLVHFFSLSSEYFSRFLLPFSHAHSLYHSAPWMALILSLGFLFLLFLLQQSPAPKDKILFGCGWMALGFGSFLFVSGIEDNIGPYLGEHFLYFSAVGYAILLAALLNHLRFPVFKGTLIVLIAAYFLTMDVNNHQYWVSEEVLLTKISQAEGDLVSAASLQLLMKYPKAGDAEKNYTARQ